MRVTKELMCIESMTCSVDVTGPRTSFVKSSYFVIFLSDFWSLDHRVCQNSFWLSLSLRFSSPALPRAGAKWFCICPCGGRTRCSGCQERRWCGRQLHLLSQAMPTPHYFFHLKMFGSYKISEDKQDFGIASAAVVWGGCLPHQGTSFHPDEKSWWSSWLRAQPGPTQLFWTFGEWTSTQTICLSSLCHSFK